MTLPRAELERISREITRRGNLDTSAYLRGMGPLTLRKMLTREGLPTRWHEKEWPAEKTAQLQTLVDAGLSIAEAARTMGISKGAAVGKLWRMRRAPA